MSLLGVTSKDCAGEAVAARGPYITSNNADATALDSDDVFVQRRLTDDCCHPLWYFGRPFRMRSLRMMAQRPSPVSLGANVVGKLGTQFRFQIVAVDCPSIWLHLAG